MIFALYDRNINPLYLGGLAVAPLLFYALFPETISNICFPFFKRSSGSLQICVKNAPTPCVEMYSEQFYDRRAAFQLLEEGNDTTRSLLLVGYITILSHKKEIPENTIHLARDIAKAVFDRTNNPSINDLKRDKRDAREILARAFLRQGHIEETPKEEIEKKLKKQLPGFSPNDISEIARMVQAFSITQFGYSPFN